MSFMNVSCMLHESTCLYGDLKLVLRAVFKTVRTFKGAVNVTLHKVNEAEGRIPGFDPAVNIFQKMW